MTDNELMITIKAELDSQLTGQGVTDFEVSRNQQPTNQYTGADKDDPIKTRVFLYAITNPTNWRSRRYTGEDVNLKRTDIYHKSKSIQISVLHYFDYTDVNALTPEDMCNLVRDLIDSPDAIKNLRDNRVYLQEAGDVRPVFTVNDKDQTESMPSFDIIVNYQQSIVKSAGYVDTVVDETEGV